MMTELERRVARVLEEEVRPALQTTGGDIELVRMDGPVAIVRLSGTCGGCPSTAMTLVMGIERQVRERVPEVEYLEISAG
jgi:Fe-S cluster biogenesis protein NfuA